MRDRAHVTIATHNRRDFSLQCGPASSIEITTQDFERFVEEDRETPIDAIRCCARIVGREQRFDGVTHRQQRRRRTPLRVLRIRAARLCQVRRVFLFFCFSTRVADQSTQHSPHEWIGRCRFLKQTFDEAVCVVVDVRSSSSPLFLFKIFWPLSMRRGAFRLGRFVLVRASCLQSRGSSNSFFRDPKCLKFSDGQALGRMSQKSDATMTIISFVFVVGFVCVFVCCVCL